MIPRIVGYYDVWSLLLREHVVSDTQGHFNIFFIKVTLKGSFRDPLDKVQHDVQKIRNYENKDIIYESKTLKKT